MSSIPTVFISYSHDSRAHEANVLKLADRLVRDQVDVICDVYEDFPRTGWSGWVTASIEQSSHIIVVCSPGYSAKLMEETNKSVGNGVRFEVLLTRQLINEYLNYGKSVIPVTFGEDDNEYIPLYLRAFQRYVLNCFDELAYSSAYDSLYRVLTSQPKNMKPPLGRKKIMPPNNQTIISENNDLYGEYELTSSRQSPRS